MGAQVKPKRRWLRILGQLGCAGLGILSAMAVIGLIALGIMYRQYVIVDPGPHLDPVHIRSIISQESPVYYRDGVTRIGVFFEDEHRQYVGTSELPLAWEMGIVAAEDGQYWSHPGLSLKHFVRALRDNIKAGRVVAGGSTLTQQTAKNLYYRPDRSLKSKGTEFVNALRLEAHYDKHQILTFYANQFHVSGNGRGLGIAARYFFDKRPDELAVEEAAFISGLVKAPSRYDPFLGDSNRRNSAREKAHARTQYVLGRMVTEPLDHLIPPRRKHESEAELQARAERAAEIRDEAQRLLDEGFELEFKRGTFRFASNAVLDEVARRLAEQPFDAVLEAAGIEDPSTAGLRVITTLDPAAQRNAVYGLWHHLTEVGVALEAKTVDDFKIEGRVSYDPDRPLRVGDFERAVVDEHVLAPKKHLRVDLGGRMCTVDRDAMIRAAGAVAKGQAGSLRAKVPGADIDAFVDALAVGTTVLVSIRDIESEVYFCDLEVRPELQGALMVLQDGEIRAMVTGNDNRNFNRTTALRQMGSTWKPLIYHTALQLGWSPADPLDNRRNVFPFSTTFYYPRPDHDPDPIVSMSWAGVRSENLSSVWLLYHMTDRLDGQQVAALATSLGLARRPDEEEKAYRTRIQKLGVLPTRGRLAEIDFLIARDHLLKTGTQDRLALQSLYYGWGFDDEAERVRREGGREMQNKLDALKNSWKHLRGRMDDCRTQYEILEASWKRGRLPQPLVVEDLSVMVGEDGIEVACGMMPEGFGPVGPTLEGLADGGDTAALAIPGQPTEPMPVEELPRERRGPFAALRDTLNDAIDGLSRPKLRPLAELRIEERFSLGTLAALDAAVKRQQITRQIAGDVDLYDPSVLYWHPDFRVLLSLSLVEATARRYGVDSEIRPVLSLPLGANEVSLEEVASVYQGLTTGKTWTFPGTANGTQMPAPAATALLIKEIQDVDGNVIYRAEGRSEQVATPEIADMTADILANVVQYGTGQRALNQIRIGGQPVPVGGKTGTTNDFKNAAFVGFVPAMHDGDLRVGGGYTVAAYVGYDDNRRMKRKQIILAGANGALPAWIHTAQGMADAGLLGEADASDELQITTSSSLVRVPAGEDGGLKDEGAWEPGKKGILVPLPAVPEVPAVEFERTEIRPVRERPVLDHPPAPERPRGLWRRRRR